MPTKNEIFMLAKINVLENITAQFLVMFLEALKPGSPELLEMFEHNFRLGCQLRAEVHQGTAEGAFEIQTEMLKQGDFFFALARHFQGNTRSKSEPAS